MKVANSKNLNKAPTMQSLGLAQPASGTRAVKKVIEKGKKVTEVQDLADSEDDSSSGDTVLYVAGESESGTPKRATKRKKRVSIAWANGGVKMPSKDDKTLVRLF